MTIIDRVLSVEEETDSLARYLPGGRAFGAKFIQGTKLRQLLRGMADELVRVADTLRLFRTDIVPDATLNFIPEWESALGIPEECFGGPNAADDDERRSDIVAKLASLGLQTTDDFEALGLDLIGTPIEVLPGKEAEVLYPGDVSFGSDQIARHTIVVNFGGLDADVFPYTFPFTFGAAGTGKVSCLFLKLKPANCDMIFISVVPV